MYFRLIIPTMVVALFSVSAMPAMAQSEITGTLTAGSGSSVGGTVIGPPTASPVPGTYGSTQFVTLTSPGASSIRYTTDGSAPSCAGGGLLYTGPITVSSTLTIQAISCYSSGASSSVGIFGYVISGGSLSGTVATSSGGNLSGTVVSSPGGSLSGTVAAPSSGGGGGGGSGGSGGGGGGSSGGSVTGNSPGSVLGTSTTTNVPGVPNTGLPGLPNTGNGGDWFQVLLALLFSAALAVSGVAYLRYQTR